LITIEAKHNGYDITASAEQETVDRMLSDVFKDVDMDEMYYRSVKAFVSSFVQTDVGRVGGVAYRNVA
jgi:hypothetical protein